MINRANCKTRERRSVSPRWSLSGLEFQFMEPPCISFHPENGRNVELPRTPPKLFNWLNIVRYMLCLTAFFYSFMAKASENDYPVNITMKTEYAQKYMSLGSDLNNGDAVIHPELSASFGESGFYAGIWGAYAVQNRNAWRKFDELDYYIGYGRRLSLGESFNLGFDLSSAYLSFYKVPVNIDYIQSVASIELLNDKNNIWITPYVKIYNNIAIKKLQKASINRAIYSMGIRKTIKITAGFDVASFYEIYYNNGQRNDQSQGWSHSVIGSKLKKDVGKFSFSIGLNYQSSWEKTVNPNNDFWSTVDISYSM